MGEGTGCCSFGWIMCYASVGFLLIDAGAGTTAVGAIGEGKPGCRPSSSISIGVVTEDCPSADGFNSSRSGAEASGS